MKLFLLTVILITAVCTNCRDEPKPPDRQNLNEADQPLPEQPQPDQPLIADLITTDILFGKEYILNSTHTKEIQPKDFRERKQFHIDTKIGRGIKTGYTEYPGKYWGDCPDRGAWISGASSDTCKAECTNSATCNAFNHSPNAGCRLLNCQATEPTRTVNGWTAYSVIVPGICPSPFRLRGNECLFIPEYLSETLNWDESRQKCLSMGGDLAQPQDMVDFVNFLEESYPGFKPSTVWLGATDREVEQEWKWLSGESVPPATWEPWIGNQPSGDGNCMEIHKWPYTEFYMNDWYCHNKGYFACEIDPCSSYAGQCLFFNTIRMKWPDAVSACKAKGQRLAVIQDPATFHAYMLSNHGRRRFWLGGSDTDHEGSWVWINGQSLAGFPWGPNQPDDYRSNKDCLEWSYKKNYNDARCKRRKRYVCEPDLHELNIASIGGIAKASSYHSGPYLPMRAFDGSRYWHSHSPYTVPQSLWVEFPEPIIVVMYSFTSRAESEYTEWDGPSKYIFWGSNHKDCRDESRWVTLKEDYSGTHFAKSNHPKVGSIDNANSYRCYGFKVLDVPGRHGIKPVTIGNVHLFSELN